MPPDADEILAQAVCNRIKLVPENERHHAYNLLKDLLKNHYPKVVKKLQEHEEHFLVIRNTVVN